MDEYTERVVAELEEAVDPYDRGEVADAWAATQLSKLNCMRPSQPLDTLELRLALAIAFKAGRTYEQREAAQNAMDRYED